MRKFLKAKALLAGVGLSLAGSLAWGQDGSQSFDWVSDLPIERIKFSAEIRQRLENRINYDQIRSVSDDTDFVGSRIRLNMDVKGNDKVGAFFQIQDSRNFGGDPVNSAGLGVNGNTVNRNDEGFSLHQGYIKAGWDEDSSLQVGRFQMLYGKQKLISPLNWSNVGRAFDGVRYSTKVADMVKVDVFGTKLGEDPRGTADKDDIEFHGMYNTVTVAEQDLDVYALWSRDERRSNTAAGGPVTPEAGNRPRNTDFFTYGAAWYNDNIALTDDIKLNVGAEYSYQAGDFGPDAIRAEAFHGRLGLTMHKMDFKPRFEYQYDSASGDSSGTDGRIGRFQQLHPLGHAYHGYMDRIGRSNLVAHRLTLAASPMDDLTVAVDYHWFRLNTKRDTAYTPGGAAFVGGTGLGAGPSKDIGQELDVTVKYKINKYWGLQAGYSYFNSGKYFQHTRSGVATTAPGQGNSQFWYLQSTVKF